MVQAMKMTRRLFLLKIGKKFNNDPRLYHLHHLHHHHHHLLLLEYVIRKDSDYECHHQHLSLAVEVKMEKKENLFNHWLLKRNENKTNLLLPLLLLLLSLVFLLFLLFIVLFSLMMTRPQRAWFAGSS